MPRPPRRAQGRVIRHAVREQPAFQEDDGFDSFDASDEDVREAQDVLAGLGASFMKGVEQAADQQLRKRGMDPDLTKDIVRRGVALSRALLERRENGGPLEDVWDDPEEYDEDDFGW